MDNTEKKRSPWPGRIILLTLLLLAAVLVAGLIRLEMLPAKYLAALIAALLLLISVIGLLVWDFEKRSSFAGGAVLAAVTAILLAGGIVVTSQARSAISGILSPSAETAEIGILVTVDDPAQSLRDLKGRSFGVLAAMDRESVDLALRDIGSSLGETPRVAEFDRLTDAVDALLEGREGALVMNLAYLDILDELEGYENVNARLREISRVGVTIWASPAPTAEMSSDDGVFTVYISGIDNRGGLIARSRSDVNILATVNTSTHQVLLVSTPRDFYVPLSISNGVPDKLTHAGIYGVEVSKDTMAMLYDLDIDYYFKVSFTGFERIIDSLGGITVNSQYSFSNNGYSFHTGDNQLNGAQALAFARDRYSFAGGDRQRGRNQMAVIRGVINKLMSVELLKNYSSLLESLEGCFDTTVPYALIARLVRNQLESGQDWDVVTYSADGTGSTERTYSQGYYAYVMIPDPDTVDTAKDLMRRVRDGEIVTAP